MAPLEKKKRRNKDSKSKNRPENMIDNFNNL
jgi:hypothetical protein